jgi:hypothetical protein
MPKPAANVSTQLRHAALLPVPLLQAAATAAMSDTTTTAAMSGTTTAMYASGVQQVPDMDAVPVPRLPVGRLLRGESTTRPLRYHVIANCAAAACRRAATATSSPCHSYAIVKHVPVHKRSVKRPLKEIKESQ